MSIENNIENLKKYIDEDDIYTRYKNGEYKKISDFELFCINHCKDIEKLLKDYIRQKQINEEHQKINGKLREKVRMLDEAYTGVIKESKKWFDIAHNSIPIQKIKNKIDEIIEDKDSKYYYEFLEFRDIQKTIDILSELLQEEDK